MSGTEKRGCLVPEVTFTGHVPAGASVHSRYVDEVTGQAVLKIRGPMFPVVPEGTKYPWYDGRTWEPFKIIDE